MNSKKIINLDCSFRDGGYYNNWSFKKSDIDFYLDHISKTKIRYIEIGFRFLNSRNSGLTAYSTDQFLKNLKIKNNLKIGVMINATDFILDGKKVDPKKLDMLLKAGCLNNLSLIHI